MKNFKLALPIFALILAVGASAFTTKHHSVKSTSDLFWYKFENGQATELIDESAISKEDANEVTQCPDSVSPDCARGYSAPLQGSLPQTPTVQEQDHIMKN